MKSEIYNALASLNRGFDVALEALSVLHEEGVAGADYVQEQREIVEEIRAGINTIILEKLSGREIADREHYGKMRSTSQAAKAS